MESFRLAIKHLLYTLLISSNFYICAHAQYSTDKSQPQSTPQIGSVTQALKSLNEEFRKLCYAQTKIVMDEFPQILIISSDSVTALSHQARTIYPLS